MKTYLTFNQKRLSHPATSETVSQPQREEWASTFFVEQVMPALLTANIADPLPTLVVAHDAQR